MNNISLKEFYQDTFGNSCPDLDQLLSNNVHKNIGHFNVFNIESIYNNCKSKPEMPYNRRTYYKVSLIKGENRVEYADRTIEIKEFGVLFATPKIPYRYTPITSNQSGHFCVFTKEFVPFSKTGFDIDSLPIFSNQSDFIYQISENQYLEINTIFEKMHFEIDSDYEFKYDLLGNYLNLFIMDKN